MPLRLYFDENASRPVLDALRRQGFDVLTVQEDARAGTPDEEVLERCAELERVLFTRDRDFLRIAERYQRRGIDFAPVIFADQVGVTIRQMVEGLVLLATACETDELRGRVTRLPIR